MSLLSGVGDFFGLDISSAAIRAVQLKGRGATKTLLRYGSVEVDTQTATSDSPTDQQRLAATIKAFLTEVGISTKNVVVGIPSSRVFTTIVDIDKLSPKELSKTIDYQAESFIPTQLADSKFDWAVLGDSAQDPNKLEVLLSSVTNSYIEARLDMLEVIGLNVVAFEPDPLAISRALVPPNQTGAQLILDMGAQATDLIILLDGTPRLIRSIQVGTKALVKATSQNLAIDEKQAEQFVFKFGLSQQKLEGQVYRALVGTIDSMVVEIEKSIKFFTGRYTNSKIEKIIVTGGVSTLPEFPLYLANKFALNIEIGNAWRNVAYLPDRQNELIAVANHYAVAAGLAERNE